MNAAETDQFVYNIRKEENISGSLCPVIMTGEKKASKKIEVGRHFDTIFAAVKKLKNSDDCLVVPSKKVRIFSTSFNIYQ